MDSVTQIILGAAVGEAALGRRVGRKAALWGAVCGTLPDLDVLIPMANEVASYTYHRGFSHSLFVVTALSPALAWGIRRIPSHRTASLTQWWLLTWLALVTHVLLDAFTTYGTQLFWPLPNPPVSISSIFIIDPMFTVPLALGLLTCLILRHKGTLARRANQVGLGVSSLYLASTLVAKAHVGDVVDDFIDLDSEEVRFITAPTPFNSLLWRVVVMEPHQYREGFVSVLDPPDTLQLRAYGHGRALGSHVSHLWSYERLDWFTNGFMRLDSDGSLYTLTDLRLGQQGSYGFSFDIARDTDHGLRELSVQSQAVPGFRIPERYFSALLTRISTPCPDPMPAEWTMPPTANLFSCE